MSLFENYVSASGGPDNILKKRSIRRIFYMLLGLYLAIFAAGGFIIMTGLYDVSGKINALAKAQESLGRRARLLSAIEKLLIGDVVRILGSQDRTSTTAIIEIIRGCYDCHHRPPVISNIRGLEENIKRYAELRGSARFAPRLYSEAVIPLALKTAGFAESALDKAVLFTKDRAERMEDRLLVIKRVWLAGMAAGLGLFLLFSAASLRRVSQLQSEAEREHGKVIQSEKMSALGRMLAGAAHELNNPLTAILGYSALLKKTTSDKAAVQSLDTINRAAERMARIIQNLLTYSRSPRLEIRPVPVREFITESAEYALAAAHATDLKVSIEAPDDLVAYIDRPHMEQVLTNLIINAAQAIKESGTGDVIKLKAWMDADRFYLSVSDNGPGIPEGIMGNIFEPFFTTKRPGKGTGLGLSICYAIVKSHKGMIHVNSAKNKGAEFVIELPYMPEKSNEPVGIL